MSGLKKVVVWGGGLLALVVVAVAVLPFIIDFNHFKPQIKAIVAENVQADLEFSSARLTIFPNLGVRLKDVVLENRDPEFNGIRTFAVGHLDFHVEFRPLLSKELRGFVQVDQPEIRFIQKGARNNLAALSKPSDGQQPSAPAEQKAPAEPADPEKTKQLIEEFKNKVSITALRINDALVVFKRDDGTDANIRGLNVHLEDIGLERDIKTHIFTDLAVSAAGSHVTGPIDLKLTSRIQMKEGEFEQLGFDGRFDFSRLDIRAAGGAFTKGPAIPLHLDFKGTAKKDAIELNPMNFTVHNIVSNMQMTVRDFNALNTDLTFKLETDQITALGDLLPQHKAMLMSGNLNVGLGVKGALSQYEKLAVNTTLNAKLSGSDFAVRLGATQLMPPHAKFSLVSQSIDLGALLGPFTDKGQGKEGQQPAKDAGQAEEKPAGEEPPPEEFALTEEQKGMLMGSDVSAKIEMNKITYDDLKLQSFGIDFHHQDLEATLNRFQVAMFGGMISSSGKLDLGAAPVTYQGKFGMDKVDINQVTVFVDPRFAETVSGLLSLDLDIQSRGTTKDNLINSLNGKGMFRLHEGRVNSASVAQLMGQEVDKYTRELNPAGKVSENFAKIRAKLPAPLLAKLNLDQKEAQITDELNKVKNLSVSDKLSKSRDLKDVKGEITIKDGVVNFATDHKDASGLYALNLDVKLDGTLAGKHSFTASPELKAQLEKATKYAALLYDDGKNLVIPFMTSGTAMEPKVQVDFAPLKAQFEDNARAALEDELKKQLGNQKGQLLELGKQRLKEELDKKKKEAQARLDAEKAKVKANADAEKKKAQDKGTDALKEKLKGKLPNF